MLIRARVTSGRGWAAKCRVQEIASLSEMEGTQIFPGSLNLIGSSPVWLDVNSAVYRRGSQVFWRGRFEGMPVLINRWSSCPAHVFEVFAAVRLRTLFELSDGDVVNLEFADELISLSSGSPIDRLVWYAFWKFRENQIFRDGKYLALLRSRKISPHTWRGMQRL